MRPRPAPSGGSAVGGEAAFRGVGLVVVMAVLCFPGRLSMGWGYVGPVRVAILTTSYPAWDGDPCGHFVRTEAVALGREAEVVVITAGTVGTTPNPSHEPRVLALEGGGAFGWPGVAARVGDNPLRA